MTTSPSPLARIVVASAISELGDWFTYIAMTVLAATARADGAPLALAAVILSQTVPRALLAPLAGVLVDRYDRRALAVGALVLRGALVFAMAVAAHAGALRALLALHVTRMALGALSEAAVRAAMPRWLDAPTLVRASRILAALWSAWLALGLLAGGVVTAVVSPAAALLVDACSFVLAAGVLQTLPAVPPAPRAAGAPAWALRELRASSAAQPALLRCALARAPLAMAAGGGFVALGLRARGTTAAATLTLTAVLLLRAAGNALGGAWAAGAARRGPGAFTASVHLAFVAGLLGVACFAREVPAAVLGVAAVLWGAGLGAQWTLVTLTLQRESPDAVLGRWLSAELVAFTLAQGLGGLIVALMAHHGRAGLALPAALALALVLALAWWRFAR